MSVDKSRIAVYIAGDRRILYPSLVTINSIREYNVDASCFDFFLSFDRSELETKDKKVLEKYDINFIDSSDLNKHGDFENIPVMHEKRYPAEILYNWTIIHELHELGYKRALKIDYDIICVDQWDLSDLIIDDSVFIAASWNKQNLYNDGINESTVLKLGFGDTERAKNCTYFNAGFVLINVDKYVENKIFSKFIEIYSLLLEQEGRINAAEQVALSILATLNIAPVKSIPQCYNYRVNTFPFLDEHCEAKVKNLHFVTSNKPWKELNYNWLSGYAQNKKAQLYFPRILWLQAASKVPEVEDALEVHQMSASEYIGMYTTILKEIYKNI